jgi:vacuolar protein sorting-associated protein 11
MILSLLYQLSSHEQEDERQIAQYTEETSKMRDEIHDLKTSARVFQLHKCTAVSGKKLFGKLV